MRITRTETADSRQAGSRQGFWRRVVLHEKLSNPLGMAIVVLAAVAFGGVIASHGLELGIVMMGLVVGLPIVAASLINLRFGVAFVLFISFFLMGIKKAAPDIPFGIFLDAGILVLFVGMFFRQSGIKRSWDFASNPISWVILAWIGYNVLQIANPVAESRVAWFYTVRGMAGTIVLFYIALYSIRSLNYIKILIAMIIGLAVLMALYGLYQENVGMLPFEKAWLNADIERLKLIYQGGRYRTFSFLSDPTTFGILMAYMSVLTSTMIFGPWRLRYKVVLVIATLLCMYGAILSGTRTAFVVIPAGMVFVGLMAVAKKQWAYIGVLTGFMAMGAVAMSVSTSNGMMYRVQSAFNPQEDRSYQVRMKTQARIKGVIQSHPFGGGLGSCGAWGQQFAPYTVFATIEPDSGYVRVAVELGWVGLFLYCVMLLTILRVAVKHLMRARDPAIINLYMGLNGTVFALYVANYGQEALILLPNSIVFFIIIAILARLKDFDPNYVQTDKVAAKSGNS